MSSRKDSEPLLDRFARFLRESDPRGQQVLGPIPTILAGLLVTAAGGGLAWFVSWAIRQFIANPNASFTWGTALLIGIPALLSLGFLALGFRLIFFPTSSPSHKYYARVWVGLGALALGLAGISFVGLLHADQFGYAIEAALVCLSVAFACFAAAVTNVDQDRHGPFSQPWNREPITWKGTRDWVIQNRRALTISFVISALCWIAAFVWGQHVFHGSLPAGAMIVSDDAFQVARLGDKLILTRDVGHFGFGFGFCICWMCCYFLVDWFAPGGRYSKRSLSPLSAVLALLPVALFGLMLYSFAWPALKFALNPQVVCFDPSHDLVSYDGRPWGRMSTIDSFFGGYKSAGRSSRGWFGIQLKNGNYIILDDSHLIGSGMPALADYMNQYLKQYPTGQGNH